MKSGWILACLLVPAAAGCLTRSPVGTEYVGPDYEVLEDSALYSDEPSALTEWTLELLEAEDVFDERPEDVLEYVHGIVVQQPRRNLSYVLAELAYLAGKRTGNTDLFLLSAVAAFSYLEGDEEAWGEYPSPYDRHFRWACDMYNRAVARAFAGEEPGTLVMQGGERHFPGGSLHVELDWSHFPYETRGIELLVANQRRLRGLEFRQRDSGLGAPLIAVVREAVDTTSAESLEGLERTSVTSTAFLRLAGDLLDTRAGLAATLELHATTSRQVVEVAGRELPLESDQSATIAYGTELAGFWRQDLRGLFRGANARASNGLVLPRPYRRGKIPVVLVHGTASSPTYWTELLNSLTIDPTIRENFQFWLFIYTTGNPIAYSAGTLRRELEGLVASVDPGGEDPALRRMVLIGHSQGGLLIKMLGMTFDADEVVAFYTGKSLDQLGLEEQDERVLRTLFDFKTSPFVERMVFVSTPHRGSFLAASWISRTLARMIAVPGDLLRVASNLRQKLPEEELPKSMKNRIATSLDNMNPNSPFLKLLLETEIDPRIQLHSIISIGNAKDLEKADDGVVSYESAHLEGVASEMLVPTGHSCQSHPRTLLEIRRILYEHLGRENRLFRPGWQAEGPSPAAKTESGEER